MVVIRPLKVDEGVNCIAIVKVRKERYYVADIYLLVDTEAMLDKFGIEKVNIEDFDLLSDLFITPDLVEKRLGVAFYVIKDNVWCKNIENMKERIEEKIKDMVKSVNSMIRDAVKMDDLCYIIEPKKHILDEYEDYDPCIFADYDEYKEKADDIEAFRKMLEEIDKEDTREKKVSEDAVKEVMEKLEEMNEEDKEDEEDDEFTWTVD